MSSTDRPEVKSDGIWEIIELLREVDPREYEKYARFYNLKDFKPTLSEFQESFEVTLNFCRAIVPCSLSSDFGVAYHQREVATAERSEQSFSRVLSTGC